MNEDAKVNLFVVSLLVFPIAALGNKPQHVCATIENNEQRLACYDEHFVATADVHANAQPRPSAADNGDHTDQTIAATSVAADGDAAVSSDSTRNTEAALPSKEVDLSATVARVAKKARGQHVVYLENGQVWQENFASSYFPVEPGDRITIKRRRFGGYRLVVPSGKGYRVERVR